jgi:hypothetical protein
MSPAQRWWTAAASAAVLGLGLLGWRVTYWLHQAASDRNPSSQELPSMGRPGDTSPARWTRPPNPVDPASVALAGQTRALARAYAYAGQRRDGRLPPDAALDAEASTWLPAAEQLLDQQTVGNWQQFEPPAAEATATAGGVATVGDRGLIDASHATELPPGHAWPRQRTVSQPPPAEAVLYDDRTLAIQIPGMQADLAFRADEHVGDALTIVDRSGGRHVLVVQTDDAGDLRLDGGLIVPGRAYLITGEHRFSGGRDAHLLIRPVDAVSGFHPGPAGLPSGEG